MMMMMLSAVDSSKKRKKMKKVSGGTTGDAVSTPPSPSSLSLLGTTRSNIIKQNKKKEEDNKMMKMMLWTPPTTSTIPPPTSFFLSSKTTTNSSKKWTQYPLPEESACDGIFHHAHEIEEVKDAACDKNFFMGGKEEEQKEEEATAAADADAADSNRKKKKDDETLMMMEGDMGGGEGYNKDAVSLYGDDSNGLGVLSKISKDDDDDDDMKDCNDEDDVVCGDDDGNDEEVLLMKAKPTDEDMEDCNNQDDDDFVSLCGRGDDDDDDDEASWMTTMKPPSTPTRNNTAAACWPVQAAAPGTPIKTKRYSNFQPYLSPLGCNYIEQAANVDGYYEDRFLVDSPLVGDNLRGRYYVDDIIITDDDHDHDSHPLASSLQGTTSKKTMMISNINKKRTAAVSPDHHHHHHHCHHHDDASNDIDYRHLLSNNKPGVVSTGDDDRDCDLMASSEGTTSKTMKIRNSNSKHAPAVSPDHQNHHDDDGDTKSDSQDDSSNNKSTVPTDSHHYLASSDDDDVDTSNKNTTIGSNNKRTVPPDHDDVASFDEDDDDTNLVDSNKTNVPTTDDGRDDGRYLDFTSDDDTPKDATCSVPPDEHHDHLHVGDCTTTTNLLASKDKAKVSSDDDHGGTTKNNKSNKDLQEDMTSKSLLSSAASSSIVDVDDANAITASSKPNVSSDDHGGTPTKIMVKDQQEDKALSSEESSSIPSYAVDVDTDANSNGANNARRPTVTNVHDTMYINNSNQSRKIPVSPIQHKKMKTSPTDILPSSFTSNKANVSTDDDDHHHGGTTSTINKIKDSQEDMTLSLAPSFAVDDTTKTNSPTAAAAKTITMHSSRKIPVSPIQHGKMKKTFNSSSSSSSSSTFLFPISTSPVVFSKKTKKRNIDVDVDLVSTTKQTVKEDRPANSAAAAAAAAAATHASNLQKPLLVVPGLPLIPGHSKQEADLVRKQEVPSTPPLLSSSRGSSKATNNRPGSFHGPSTTAPSLPLPASLSSFQPRRRFNEGGLNSNIFFKQQMLSSWGYGQQQHMITDPASIGGNAYMNNANNYVMMTDATKQVKATTTMMMMDPSAAKKMQYPFRGDHSTHQKDVRSCAMMTMMQGQQGPATNVVYCSTPTTDKNMKNDSAPLDPFKSTASTARANVDGVDKKRVRDKKVVASPTSNLQECEVAAVDDGPTKKQKKKHVTSETKKDATGSGAAQANSSAHMHRDGSDESFRCGDNGSMVLAPSIYTLVIQNALQLSEKQPNDLSSVVTACSTSSKHSPNTKHTMKEEINVVREQELNHHLQNKSGKQEMLCDGYGIPSQHEKREEKSSVLAPKTPDRSKGTPMIIASLETKPNKGKTKKMGNKRFQDDQTGLWTERFRNAVKFVHDHGHCRIPCQYPENQLLANWAKRQRYQFVLFQRDLEGISTTCKATAAGTADNSSSTSEKRGRMLGSTLTWERIHALNSIGFCWDTRELAWLQHYEEFKDHLRKFKSPRVNANAKEYRHDLLKHILKTNPKLRTWIKCQQHQYKRFQNGLNSHMTDKRLELLSVIGFFSHLNPKRNPSGK